MESKSEIEINMEPGAESKKSRSTSSKRNKKGKVRETTAKILRKRSLLPGIMVDGTISPLDNINVD